jgi:riboflavin kinase/FMN adenylyltransferase
MKVHFDITRLPVFRNAVVTIGTFDGVHRGHAQILEKLQETAAAMQGETVVITFHPHPRKVVSSKPLLLINTLKEKSALLRQKSIDHLVVVPFTAAFAEQTATAYVEHFLVQTFHPHALIIGYDHHFGKNREGNFQLLEQYAASGTFQLIEIPAHITHDITVSSTKIREALLTGDLATANDLLGYSYFFEGAVVKGNQLGRTLDFATANLQINDADKLVPGNGVYAVKVHLKTGVLLNGMMNIGIRPTVDGQTRMVEVHIFDFNEDIYGETLQIHLVKYLRGEQKFSGLDALKVQLAKDRDAAIISL